MDQKQRTILCSMHYREVSTLNDLRNAAFTLQSSAFPADSAVVKGSRPDTANESTIGALSLWQGPISIMDILLDQSHQLQPVREEMLNDTSLGDSDGAINTRQEGASFGFRIGSLVVHSVGSFEPPGPAYYETGLGNDMDLEIKYDAQLERGARIADHLKTTTKQQEVLALPFGYKCERRLRLDPHNSLCSVTAEIIRCRSVGHLGSKVPMDDNGSWTVAFGAKPENADQDQVRDDMEDNEVELSWKITITRLGGNNPGDREHSSVFYSDSMRDAVESIFQPPGKDTADGTATPPKQYGHYLRVPSAFFGLDHPVIRQTILSLSGEKAVSSRMWQRYRLNQRLAEQQCNDHGCFQLPTTTKTTTVSHAKGRQRSFEQQDSMSAARTRSRPLSRQLRKKVVRVGIAYGSRHEDGRAGVQDQSNPKSHKRGRSLVPGLSQDLTKTVITSPTSMLPLQSSKVASSPISTRSRSSKDPEIPDQAVTLEQFQKVRTEQSSNVTLYWNGRKMNITSITPTATTSTAKSKDSGISGLGHDEHLQANETDPKQQTLDTDMDIDQPVDRSMNASKTASSGGASRPLADMASLPVQAQTDLRIYAARAFEKDEMILEYVGELVSPAVALRRQESYQSHGRGYYMMWCEFQEAVIDATNQGGVARHIRHEERDVKDKTNGNGSDDSGGDLGSVYARTVAVPAGQNPKVVICASRRLKAGDELTMRYSS
ncbi:Myeloid lymphoid or mixed-lineage leukemia 2 [Mortierella sp. GBA43]|nr:Myeloid lymphoid or mixed-lineage leukemia 2 [Mortierella sp. GBA43]